MLVVGGGPVGLYAAYCAGLRGLSARVVEARPEIGGQLSALYPEKFIYDAPGFSQVRAGQLVQDLSGQLARFSPIWQLGELAGGLKRLGGRWQVTTDRGAYTAGAVILAAGIGALRTRGVSISGAEAFPDLRTEFVDARSLSGQDVLVFGGVPQATRAALALQAGGARVTLAHRRAGFRGTPEQLERLADLRDRGEIQVLAPAELGRFMPGGAELIINGEPRFVGLDAAYVLNGYLPDLAPLEPWGLTWRGEYVVAGGGQTTNLPGVFVAGDLSSSGGDLKLLAQGFAEAAVAANHAAHFVRPELKVRPGHSSDKLL